MKKVALVLAVALLVYPAMAKRVYRVTHPTSMGQVANVVDGAARVSHTVIDFAFSVIRIPLNLIGGANKR